MSDKSPHVILGTKAEWQKGLPDKSTVFNVNRRGMWGR